MVDVLTNKGTMCETQCLVRNAVPCAKRSALCETQCLVRNAVPCAKRSALCHPFNNKVTTFSDSHWPIVSKLFS
jgi:hypothetical protein